MYTKRISVTNSIILLLFFSTFYVRTIIPFSGVVFDRIYYIEIFLFFLLLLSYLDFNKLLKYRFGNLNLFHLLIFISFLLFIISSFYYNFKYNNNLEAFTKIVSYFVIIFSFFFIFAKQLYLSKEFFEKLTDIVILIGFILSFYAILDLFFLKIYPIKEYQFSAPGIIAHPNNASFIYTLLIPLVIYKYFSKRISYIKFIFLLIFFLLCLLFTYSRAGYIGVTVAILILTFYKSKTIFTLSIVIIIFLISTFLLEFITAKGSSSISRGMLIITAISMITNDTSHFLWGYGVTNAIDVFIAEKIYAGNFEDVVTPHNLILLLAIQFGALFTISLILSAFYVYIKLVFIKRKLKSDDNKLRINVCIAISVGLIMQDILEGMMGYPEFFIMPIFFVFFGYLYYTVRYYKKIKN